MTKEVRVITADKWINCEHLLGTFLDESHYDLLIEEDCDFYMPNNSLLEGNGEHNIAFKFRKGVYTAEEQLGAYEGLIKGATESQNRGLAAGPKTEQCGGRDWVTDWQMAVLDTMMNPHTTLDGSDPVQTLIAEKASYKAESTRGLVWLRNKITARLEPNEEYEGFFDTWLAKTVKLSKEEQTKQAKEMADCISGTTYATVVNSGIAGFFDRYPRIPYGRVCAYNWKNPELFEKAFPYFRKLDKFFKDLLPQRYGIQKQHSDALDKRFRVAEDTVFTTVTINKNFRTAAHRDAGDLAEGYSNLGVVTNGKDYRGGYLVLPEFRVAINIRPGDVLLVANHAAIHGNTEILPPSDDCCMDCVERMSIVCYFRENMKELGSWEYETLRRDFVEARRLNQDHPEWRPLWNGVSPNMWETKEWYKFIEGMPDNDGKDMLAKYHPEALETKPTSLEAFFS